MTRKNRYDDFQLGVNAELDAAARRARWVAIGLIVALAGLCALWSSRSHAEQLALVSTPAGACIAGAPRASCTVQRLDTPKADDLVFPCPTTDGCWVNGTAMPAAKFADLPSTTAIDGCNNPAVAKGAALPNPWDATKDPCGDHWKIVLKSAYTVNTTGAFRLTWTPPTQNTDGSALTDLAGFWVYSAANGAPLGKLVQLKQPTLTQSELSGYGPGVYQFAMTAYNAKGAESTLTTAVSITIVQADKVPGQPVNVTITRVEFSSP